MEHFKNIIILSVVITSVLSQFHYQNKYISPVQKISNLEKQQLTRQFEDIEALHPVAPTTHPHPPPPFPSSTVSDSPPRCGESFNCTSSGIFHHPFEPVQPHERCVWTVVVPGASGYQVEVFYLGWDPKDNSTGSQVLINGFKRGSPPTELSATGKGFITIPDASILVITFITGENPGNSTGFILQYTTLTNGTIQNMAAQSVHRLVQPETIYLRHPHTNFYQNNELSSFVFQPKNNFYKPGGKSNLVYMRIGLDGPTCEDHLDVYGLNITDSNGLTAKWDFRGRICGYLDTQLVSGNDLLMIIFTTDPSGTNHGFHLTYTTC